MADSPNVVDWATRLAWAHDATRLGLAPAAAFHKWYRAMYPWAQRRVPLRAWERQQAEARAQEQAG
jgi:hypothetical protein